MNHINQLGFDALLDTAERENEDRKFARKTAHLRATMAGGLPFYRVLLDRHHGAMLDGDVGEIMRLREEAHDLACKLNGGDPGILAHEDAPGRVLERETAAAPGTAPLWGQRGAFIITVDAMRARIELEGIFGNAAQFYYWPGFAAHAVDVDRPFLSATGYRSFLGLHADPVPGLTPESYAVNTIAAYVADALNGSLRKIKPRYREKPGTPTHGWAQSRET